MGCYVFSRVHDMFRFFRMEEKDRTGSWMQGRTLSIGPGYWAGKLDAVDRHSPATEFCEEKFRARVAEFYKDWRRSWTIPDDVARDLRDDLRNSVLIHADSEHDAYRAAYEFSFESGRHRFDLQDFGSCERFSFRYIWACYAIVWGIWHYDQRDEYAAFWRSAA
jgi:hypothetical protein